MRGRAYPWLETGSCVPHTPTLMRTFEDSRGRRWEVVAGRESWGAIFAIFVPEAHDADLRQSLLGSSSYEEANGELGRMDEDELRALLARSNPKLNE